MWPTRFSSSTPRALHGTGAQAAPGEWDKVLIIGRQIAPDDAMFKGEAGAAPVDLVDVNLEGGENPSTSTCLPRPDEEACGPRPLVQQRRAQAPAAGQRVFRPGLPARRAEARLRRRADARVRPAVAHAGNTDDRDAADGPLVADAARAHDPRESVEGRADRRAVAGRPRPGRRFDRFRLARRHDFAGEGCDGGSCRRRCATTR